MAKTPENREDLAGLYRAAVRRHASAPVGYRQPIDATHRHEEYNPLCGDRIEVHLRVGEEIIESAAFDGEGCAICMASASLLCSLAPGYRIDALLQLSETLQNALELPPGENSRAAVGAASAAILFLVGITHRG
jgi:nitrogen fixation NifU-like protein